MLNILALVYRWVIRLANTDMICVGGWMDACMNGWMIGHQAMSGISELLSVDGIQMNIQVTFSSMGA
jgi:hypothetical protein